MVKDGTSRFRLNSTDIIVMDSEAVPTEFEASGIPWSRSETHFCEGWKELEKVEGRGRNPGTRRWRHRGKKKQIDERVGFGRLIHLLHFI